MPKTTISINVPKDQGEKAIAIVAKLGLFDKKLEIQRDKNNLFIPLVREPHGNECVTIFEQLPRAEFPSRAFDEKRKPSETFIQILENQLPPNLLTSLPKAFDIIGDIIVIEIPPELKNKEVLIGQAILKSHRNVKTVLAKVGAINGTYRTREYNIVAGENKTNTTHREFGCQYFVDLAKAYFSPRLSHEHDRIVSLVQEGETVVDLFAGVGPFSVLIGKRHAGSKVFAVDLNPDAVELLKINVRVNRVESRVFPILADARQIASGKLRGVGDRVIMNLPETAFDFLDVACQVIKLQGGIIHFYGFIRAPDSIENLKHRLTQAVETSGRKIENFLYSQSIRETAPYESQVVVDAKIV